LVVVFYQNERGAQICEYLRLDAGGKIRQGVGESSGALNGACATPFNVDRQSNPVIARSNATKQSIFLDAARWIASLRSQ
jgi:hypothetical protein